MARSDLDHHGKDHRPPARPVVDDLPERVVDVLLEQLDLGRLSAASSADDAIGLLAQLVEQLVVLRRPRAISSGGASSPPSESATVVTTISTPSSDSRRRSRSATSWTSPTPSPSTNVTPDSIRSTIRTPPRASSTTDPFSASRSVLGDAGVARELGVRGEHPVLAVDRHHRLGRSSESSVRISS